jgi:hypothetical protein
MLTFSSFLRDFAHRDIVKDNYILFGCIVLFYLGMTISRWSPAAMFAAACITFAILATGRTLVHSYCRGQTELETLEQPGHPQPVDEPISEGVYYSLYA